MSAADLTATLSPSERVAPAAQLAPIAAWIAAIFIAPLDAGAVERMVNGQEGGLADDIGETLTCQQAIRQMHDAVLAVGPDNMAPRYVRLFDGVAGRRTVSLYESYYRSDGMRLFQSPVDEMNAVLRHLDMSVRAGCSEPPDHLAIEFAALATALSQEDAGTCHAMRDRLNTWLPPLRARLEADDPRGFYAAAAAVADSLLQKIGTDVQPVSQ